MRDLLHVSVMLVIAVAAWAVDPVEPTLCAGLMLVFTWCAYRIGAPNDARGWIEAMGGGVGAAMDGIRM